MMYIATGEFSVYGLADILLAKEKGEPLDYVLYPEVMFDECTPAEHPEHKEFIMGTVIPVLSELGITVIQSRCRKTYMDLFGRVVQRSPYEERVGLYRGFPKNVQCYIRKEIKRQKIDQFISSYPEPFTEYVGNPNRELLAKDRISLVKKYDLSKADCTSLCDKYGLVSPAYRFAENVGCWFCPNSSLPELMHLKRKHPELWGKLLMLGGYPEVLATPTFKGKLSIREVDEQLLLMEQQLDLWNWNPEGIAEDLRTDQ